MRSGEWSACGREVAASSRGKTAEAVNAAVMASAPQDLADRFRPQLRVEAVGGEQRQRDTLQPEADAGGVGGRAVFEVQAPFRAEGVLMIVEAHAGGLLHLGGDGD